MKKLALCTLLLLSVVTVAFPQNENWRDSIADLLVNYLGSETWEEASRYVMEAERVRPLMQQQYKNYGFESRLLSKEEIKHDFGMRKIKGQQHTIYICKDRYYVIKTNNGYKVDWEASVSYSPYSEEAVKNTPNKEFELRTVISLSNDKNNWHEFFPFWVKKNTTVDNVLFDLLKDGKRQGLILKVKYVTNAAGDYDINCPGASGGRNSYLTITKVVSTNLSKY